MNGGFTAEHGDRQHSRCFGVLAEQNRVRGVDNAGGSLGFRSTMVAFLGHKGLPSGFDGDFRPGELPGLGSMMVLWSVFHVKGLPVFGTGLDLGGRAWLRWSPMGQWRSQLGRPIEAWPSYGGFRFASMVAVRRQGLGQRCRSRGVA